MPDMRAVTKSILEGCVVTAEDGTKLYTPDGQGNYPALWTRDFAYMVEDAGDLIPLEDIKNGIEYILRAVRENGWVPDRVYKDGVAFYTAGGRDFPAAPNLDNGCFLCLLVDCYLRRLDSDAATAQFKVWESALRRGIDCLPTAENGLICNQSTPPHSPYGFTDTVCKTGLLCMESLLLWKAKRALVSWMRAAGSDTAAYERDLSRIQAAFLPAFLQKDGTLKAASGRCAQTDLWAMCYAVSIGFPLPDEVKHGIATWFAARYDTVTQHGQLRHLPVGEYWEETFVPVEEGTYQNGAFWATPIKWLCDTLRSVDTALADKARDDLLWYVGEYGIFECVNGDERKLNPYVASATALYAVCK